MQCLELVCDPGGSTLAPLLVHRALRHKQVTFINTSPADHTLATIKAQGFERFCNGVLRGDAGADHASLDRQGNPVLGYRPRTGLPDGFRSALLREHAARGCLSLILQHKGNSYPMVFRRRQGRAELAVCRASVRSVNLMSGSGVCCNIVWSDRTISRAARDASVAHWYKSVRSTEFLESIMKEGLQCIIEGQTGRAWGIWLIPRLRCSVLKGGPHFWQAGLGPSDDGSDPRQARAACATFYFKGQDDAPFDRSRSGQCEEQWG